MLLRSELGTSDSEGSGDSDDGPDTSDEESSDQGPTLDQIPDPDGVRPVVQDVLATADVENGTTEHEDNVLDTLMRERQHDQMHKPQPLDVSVAAKTTADFFAGCGEIKGRLYSLLQLSHCVHCRCVH